MAFKLNFRFKKSAEKTAEEKPPEQPDEKSDEKKAAPALKIKPRKFASGERFVVDIGDEGAILLHIKGNLVLSRQFVPDASEQNLKELRTTIDQNPKAPVLLVIDNMDQSYIQQSLPPVSRFSVQKLIKRRLDRDFGKNDIKGAVQLAREESGRRDWNFLMVALERTPQLSVWLEFVQDLPNRFQGIYLVSVESEIIIRDLERALGVGKSGTGSKWKFFVSHNKLGGFRQVVMRGGRIIFTRLSQPVGEPTPEVVAGNIEQEMMTTTEYMKRIGYDTQSGLDIYILASENVRRILDVSKFKANHIEMLTPFELAAHLGIEGATQPTDQFGDVVLAAAICSSKPHILTLVSPEFQRFHSMYKMFQMQRVIGALLCASAVLYAGAECVAIIGEYSDSGNLEELKAKNQSLLNRVKDDVKRSNLDVDRTGDTIDLYQAIQKKRATPLGFIDTVQRVIKPPILVKSFESSLDEKSSGGPKAAVASGKMTAVFTLEFTGVANAEAFKVISQRVLTDLKALLPKFDVAFTKVPSNFSENEKLDIVFGEQKEATAPKTANSSEVQLTIKEK